MPGTIETASRCARVLLVDDHPLYRDALRRWLSREPVMAVCGEAGTPAEARRVCDEHNPDLIVLDLALPDGGGLALLKESRGWADPKVLVVTVLNEDDPLALGPCGSARPVSSRNAWREKS